MRTIATPEARERFLETLAISGGNVTAACKAVRISRTAAYAWRRRDDTFATDWETAYQLGIEALEDECIRRGVEGTREPIFHRGRKIGEIVEYSDRCLVFMLQNRLPAKYRANWKGGPPPIPPARAQSIVDAANPLAAATEMPTLQIGHDSKADDTDAATNRKTTVAK